ncbi:MAG TPA: hypothetical protein VNF47_04480 [Streptosporangiaceae bacterium]|nr:hypothetical protein [Streptosporangiaceae bacterium]
MLAVWPGDTFGGSALSPASLVLSRGSATAVPGRKAELFTARVSAQLL